MTRLLLTGSSGALGRHLKQRILKDNDKDDIELACLARNGSSSALINTYNADFLDISAMKKVLEDYRPDCIVHTAWETAHGSYWNDKSNIEWADATLAVADHFAGLGGGYFQFAGTCAEYSWGDDLLIENETNELPPTLYGQQKCRTTRQLLAMLDDDLLNVCCGRIFFPFSPIENPARVTSHVVSSLAGDKPVHLNDGDVYRDMMHTQHVATAFYNLLQKRTSGLFNIATGTATHLGKFLQQIAVRMGKENLLSWSEFEPGNTPKTIIGSAKKITPYLPADIDVQADIDNLIEGVGSPNFNL